MFTRSKFTWESYAPMQYTKRIGRLNAGTRPEYPAAFTGRERSRLAVTEPWALSEQPRRRVTGLRDGLLDGRLDGNPGEGGNRLRKTGLRDSL